MSLQAKTKIVCALDSRKIADRRQIFQSNIDSGKWYSCVASIDLRYHVPILFNQGRYRISLPNAFRRLGLKCNNKKFFSAARTEAEMMILQAAAILGDPVPLLDVFGPAEKRVAWKRTRNLYRREQPSAGPELIRFRPVEIGWGPLLRRVFEMELPAGAKIVLLFAYSKGFQSGAFWASSETTGKRTRQNKDHIKRTIFPSLVDLGHFKRLRREGKGQWVYGFVAPKDAFACGDLKSPQDSASSDVKSSPAVTLSRASGDFRSPKSDKPSKNIDREREDDFSLPHQAGKRGRASRG